MEAVQASATQCSVIQYAVSETKTQESMVEEQKTDVTGNPIDNSVELCKPELETVDNVLAKDKYEIKEEVVDEVKFESDIKSEEIKEEIKTELKDEEEIKVEDVTAETETVKPSGKKRGRKRKVSEEEVDSEKDEVDEVEESEDEELPRPRRRGRCKKAPDVIPPHLSSDMVLGYKILLKLLETPQFSGFHRPPQASPSSGSEESTIVCLNQIKKKFEENSYKRIAEFINDVREMLSNIYESTNVVATKRALRLEQVLEQRIAQLPNYLRPQCNLVLSDEDVTNSPNKIRINKGGGFVSLLLEKAEKRRADKDREKKKLLAEERKQLKEEQDKDVHEWEKNVLLKDHQEEVKCLWELSSIGHFIHLCTDILNIGEIAQYEVERMLLMPQCSDTLDLIMTALLSNSLVRAKLDRTPSMPYSIWGPLLRTRVTAWYRAYHREHRNAQKVFEELGVEPDFWKMVGPEHNPLDYYHFHEVEFVQRVWLIKTLCDVDFVRKKTVYDNIRNQTLDQLHAVNLGLDRHGNRYIHLRQFCGPDIRIYRQCSHVDGVEPSDLVESQTGFEHREGAIGIDKVLKDIWEVGVPKPREETRKTVKWKRKKGTKQKAPEPVTPRKNLRVSARTKRKTYVDSSDSDQSDTDLQTLRNKLKKGSTLHRPISDKEFISLSVFRLPRDKPAKQTPKKSTYAMRKAEEAAQRKLDAKRERKDSKCFEEESSDKPSSEMQGEFDKNFDEDEELEDEDKVPNFNLDKSLDKRNFSVKNLDDLKMVLKKGITDTCGIEETQNKAASHSETEKADDTVTEKTVDEHYDALYKYKVPEELRPDKSKYYCLVDSVEALRQLLQQFGSQDSDLEIITRNGKTSKDPDEETSCELELVSTLHNLLTQLEQWEPDLIKSARVNREKMYKEYTTFLSRPANFVHPNEAYWMKLYEDTPAGNANGEVTVPEGSEPQASTALMTELNGPSQIKTEVDATTSLGLVELGPRKRTRVTRLQIKMTDDDEELEEDGTLFESSESDDNWEMPVKRRRSKAVTPALPRSSSKRDRKPSLKAQLSSIDSGESLSADTPPSSVEKTKKTLFWGQRSSDPSEELNWETNRQKMLQEHNAPMKRVVYKGNEMGDDMVELEKALQVTAKSFESQSKTTKRFAPPIPGNKKPYYSSAQLKAMEVASRSGTQAHKSPGKPTVRAAATQHNAEVIDISQETPAPVVKKQTARNKMNNMQQQQQQQTAISYSEQQKQVGNSPVQLKNYSIQQTINKVIFTQQQQQPGNRVASVQQGAAKTNMANKISLQQQGVRMQGVRMQGQQMVRAQQGGQAAPLRQQLTTLRPQQVQLIQGQPVLQTTSVGPRLQQVVGPRLQQPPNMVRQPVATQVVARLQGASDQQQSEDLFLTDGKLFIKTDPTFVKQFMQKDEVLTLNINEKLDLKKQLFIVKPNPNATVDASTSNPNIVFVNKQSGLQNLVVPAGFIVKEAQGQPGTQTVFQGQAPQIQKEQTLTLYQQPGQKQEQGVATFQPPGQTQKLEQQNITLYQQPGQKLNQNIALIQSQTKSEQGIPVYQQPGQKLEQGIAFIQAPGQKIEQSMTMIQQPGQKIEKGITFMQQSGQKSEQGITFIQQPVQKTEQGITFIQQSGQKSEQGITFIQQSGQKSEQNIAFIHQPGQKPEQGITFIQQPGQKSDQNIAFIQQSGQKSDQSIAFIQQTGQKSEQGITFIQQPGQKMEQGITFFHQPGQKLEQGITFIQQPGQKMDQSITLYQQPGQKLEQGITLYSQQGQKLEQQGITLYSQSGQKMEQQGITLYEQPGQKFEQGITLYQSPGGQVMDQGITLYQQQGQKTEQVAVFQQNTQTQKLQPQNIAVYQTPAVSQATTSQAYIVQHKPVQVQGKNCQQQSILKLVATQPSVTSAQNIILRPSVKFTGQMVQTVDSTSKPASNLRFIRPQNLKNVPQLVPTAVPRPLGPSPLRFQVRSPQQQVRPPPPPQQAVRQPVTPTKVTASNQRSPGGLSQPIRLQAVSLPQTVVRSSPSRPSLPAGKYTARPVTTSFNLGSNPILVKLEDDEDEIRIVDVKPTTSAAASNIVTVDHINGELSVKETPQGFRYIVKASDGRDVILTNEQVEQRRAAHNGCMQ